MHLEKAFSELEATGIVFYSLLGLLHPALWGQVGDLLCHWSPVSAFESFCWHCVLLHHEVPLEDYSKII